MKVEKNPYESIKIAYENLANAIVMDAVEEYRDAVRKGRKGKIKKLREWFHSDDCYVLTNINVDSLLDRIEREEVKPIQTGA